MRISDRTSDVCSSDLMSLGGIAIAIGAMVDAAVVMIENAHNKLEHAKDEEGELTEQRRRQVLTEAAVEVGPALFFSLLIITLSFLPVFTLEAQEGRLFKPLAFTKTYARSEEHTSELQSLMRTSYAVFCLKKKRTIN